MATSATLNSEVFKKVCHHACILPEMSACGWSTTTETSAAWSFAAFQSHNVRTPISHMHAGQAHSPAAYTVDTLHVDGNCPLVTSKSWRD